MSSSSGQKAADLDVEALRSRSAADLSERSAAIAVSALVEANKDASGGGKVETGVTDDDAAALPTPSSSAIPRIIHFHWVNENLPPFARKYKASW